MTRFFSTFALAIALLGGAAGAAFAKPDHTPSCTVDNGYNRTSTCEVGG
jgi:hypothetical protein